VESEVCIIGGGPAGITLARELAGQPFRVALLESGGLAPDRRVRSLLVGENVGLPYDPLHRTRASALGGTSELWAGTCRPLDEIDFESRADVPGSGWPFGRVHLLPYYERAHQVCQLGPFAYAPEAWHEPTARPALPFRGDRVATTIFQFSQPPARFGRVYRDDLARSENLTVYLHATAVDLEVGRDGADVTRARVACLRGPAFSVSARIFVLAAGGIENARLLLLSDAVLLAGLGNQHDLVGRFFMEHPHLASGVLTLADPPPSTTLYETHRVRGTAIQGGLTLSPEVIRREGLLNYSVLLKPRVPPLLAALRQMRGSLRRRVLSDHVWQRLKDGVLRSRALEVRDLPPAGPRAGLTRTLLSRTEQAPNPDSRITLAEKRDVLGRRRVRLDWRLSSIDKRSLRRALEILTEEFAAADLGRLKSAVDADDTGWPATPYGGFHHMGTTRMDDDPRRGVVDRHGRVHGVSNLFVTGSSLFPTVGYANPTLTIVALALRLADHVKPLLR
jgi:choline dehydrogenase-like flavoprotein